MRISDWSSDVCSSDLAVILRRIARRQRQRRATEQRGRKDLFRHIPLLRLCLTLTSSLRRTGAGCKKISCRGRGGFWLDRKSVGSGRSVSVRVDVGGRRIIKKRHTQNYMGSKNY